MITEAQEDETLKGIWNGSITTAALPVIVYNENKDKLIEGVEKGFGSKLKDLSEESQKFKTLDSLVNNVDSFSAAKTFHQVKDMEFLKFDSNGNIVPFSEFKKEAGEVFKVYNKTWLETEFNTSISQSQAASQWSDIQANKQDLPLLQYQTADDERVRDEHTSWDNIIRPVGDPFWDTHFAPNGYNCRCQIIQLSSGKISSLSGVPENSAPLFADNAGKTEKVFNDTGKDKHPYYDDLPKNFSKNTGGL